MFSLSSTPDNVGKSFMYWSYDESVTELNSWLSGMTRSK